MDMQQKQDVEMLCDSYATRLTRDIKHDEMLAPSSVRRGVNDSSPGTHYHDISGQKEIKKSHISKLKKLPVKCNPGTRANSLMQKAAETVGLMCGLDKCVVTAGTSEHLNGSGSMLREHQSFDSKQQDVAALETISGQKSYTCDVCQLIFVDLDNLKAHRAAHAVEPGDCDVKGFAYAENNSLGFLSLGEKLCNSDICGLDAASCGHKTQVGDKLYQCDACDSLSETTRTKVKRKPYRCVVCGIAFVANCYLVRHNRIHTGEKPYKCDVCGRDFRESAQMKRHKRTHTGEKPFKCDICESGFIASYYLTRHRRKHTGEKPYKCDICDLDFNSNDCLKRHRRIHTGEKPYKCDFCDLFFRERGQMKTHKRIHTGEKPFRCEVCDLGFTQSGHLIRHRRTHTGDKPYKCDMCEQVFIQSDCLKRHKRVHVGEKPYSCDICGLDFTERISLKRHKKTHRADKTVKPDT